MKIAFGHLRYDPDVFWNMGFREWQAAFNGYREKMGGESPDEALDSEGLKELMERYPDQ